MQFKIQNIFYIFDEIDAALDKRNSERLAALLNQYMKSGQYIVITHNDAIILNSNILYGVSMHEGVSKILSLKIDEPISQQLQKAKEMQVQDTKSLTSIDQIPNNQIIDELAPLAAQTLEESEMNENEVIENKSKLTKS